MFFKKILTSKDQCHNDKNYVFYKLEMFFKPITSSIRICEVKWQFLKNVKIHFFLPISFKTLNVLQKDFNIERSM